MLQITLESVCTSDSLQNTQLGTIAEFQLQTAVDYRQ